MATIFLSYSSRDRAAVMRLAEDLRERGIDVWLDEREIAVGDSIAKRVDEGFQDSDFVAIWVTENAIPSGWVDREWQRSFMRK